MVTIRTCQTTDGRVPLDEWLAALKDVQGHARIRALASLNGWRERGKS